MSNPASGGILTALFPFDMVIAPSFSEKPEGGGRMALADRRSTILKKIEALQLKKAKCAEKLKREQKFNAAAWAEYGSELCAAELHANIQNIADEIRAIDTDIELLQEFAEPPFDVELDDLTALLEARIQNCSNEIADLEKQKKEVEDELTEKRRVKELLSE